MTDLDVSEGVPPEPMSNPADDSSKMLIDDVLNNKEDEPLELPPEPEPQLVIKEVVPDEEVFKDVKPIREKRKATKKQLEHLARAREKANATRRANKIKKEEEKLNKLKNKNDLKITQTETPEIKQVMESYPTFKQFSPEDIKKLQEDAIASYEVKRKARKENKKKAQAEAVKKQKDFDAVAKAVKFNTPTTNDDPWSLCFN